MQAIIAGGQEPRYVALAAGEYIMNAFIELGMRKADPMVGHMPLGYADVFQFSQATRKITEAWELEAVVSMSKAYCQGLEYGSRNVRREPIDEINSSL